jgi:hypothetical protein
MARVRSFMAYWLLLSSPRITMHSIHVQRELQVPIANLWALVANFSDLSWFQAAEKVEQFGAGVGEIRRISMAGMPAPIEEQLLEIDPEQHRIKYRVLESDINIMQDYTVVATLTASGPDRTLADWRGSFSGVNGDVDPQIMIDMMTGTYASMLAEMEKAAAGQP